MVDIRGLFNNLVECCEEEVSNPHCEDKDLAAVDLNEDIAKAIDKLREGIDALEEETKKVKSSINEGLGQLEEILNSLY